MRGKILLCIFSFFLLCSHAFAAAPKKIIFFGDSLTDNGNLYRLDLHFIPKSPPYFQGRFSNGPTWAEMIGDYFQKNYQTDYSVYAWGGATAVSHLYFNGPAVPITLGSELNRYLFDYMLRDHSQHLFSIWIGGNDYFSEPTGDMDTLTTTVVNKISDTITSLISHHARQFLVFNLPDLSSVPFAASGDQDKNRLHELTLLHNQKLTLAVSELKTKNPDITIVYVDIGTVFADLIANPAKYNEKYHSNIQNTGDSCWPGGYRLRPNQVLDPGMGDFAETVAASPALYESARIGKLAAMGYTPCPQPEQYVFWDHIHPTTAMHEILATVTKEALLASGIWNPPS